MLPPVVLGFVKPLYSYFRRAGIDTTLLLTTAKISLTDAEIDTNKYLFSGREWKKC